MSVTMESWRKVWRDGITPLLSLAELLALRDGLFINDNRLIQGLTAYPELMTAGVRDSSVTAACALGYCGWQGKQLSTVGQVEDYFAQLCCKVGDILGDPVGCRFFLDWFDRQDRDDIIKQLLPEVERSIDLKNRLDAMIPSL